MSPHPEILALLTAFQHGYTQRDPGHLDEFMRLFTPGVEAIGTNGIRPGQGEWFHGREAVRALIEGDWQSWGDFQLDFDSLQIHAQTDTAWVSAFATVANTIGPDAYQNYLNSLPALLQDPAQTAPDKLREILRGASNTLYELEKGEKFIWPLRFTAVIIHTESGWQFAQLHFSFATTRFPDVRLSATD